MQSEIMIHVIRGNTVESIHRGHAAVIRNQGKLIGHVGNPGCETYIRSTAKLLQAIPVIESDAAERFGFTPAEIALMCASHNGEEQHAAGVRSMLAKIGLDETALQCGIHDPYDAASVMEIRQNGLSPTRVHNNCSGKHAGMLALAVHQGHSFEGYMNKEHPVQQSMLAAISAMADYPEERISIGVDGCGVPVFVLPLHRLAMAYSRLAGTVRGAASTILESIASHPYELAGRARFDTQLVQATGGRIIGKMGAEGMYAAVHRAEGTGIAVKIEDGSSRALYPAVMEIMKQLQWLRPEEERELASFHCPLLHNRAGEPIGRLEPVLRIRR
jgi:L-asparaginase II